MEIKRSCYFYDTSYSALIMGSIPFITDLGPTPFDFFLFLFRFLSNSSN